MFCEAEEQRNWHLYLNQGNGLQKGFQFWFGNHCLPDLFYSDTLA